MNLLCSLNLKKYKLNLVIIILGILLSISELMIKLSYQIFGFKSISLLIDYIIRIQEINLNYLGILIFIGAWVLAIIVRIFLSIPFAYKDAKQVISQYRISIMLSSFLIGKIFLLESITFLQIIGLICGISALYYFQKTS